MKEPMGHQLDRTAPLAGIRVIELGMGWAAPLAGMLLADFGAEVIKIESIKKMDWWRGGDLGTPDAPLYEKVSLFNGVNRNKLGCTLDLTDHKGLDLFKRLISISDVLLENFTPRVMTNFGLDYNSVRSINPSLIMVSIPAFGLSGPWRDFGAVAATVEALSGIAGLSGHPDKSPYLQGHAGTDPFSGVGAAISVITALTQLKKTGRGQHVELAHQELAIHLVVKSLMDYIMNGRDSTRKSNTHPTMSPHGVYRCRGDDDWIAIAIRSDEEWRRFCDAVGQPEAASDDRFVDILARLRHREELDTLVESWTCSWERHDLVRCLQRASVPAAPVNASPDVLADPIFKKEGSFLLIEREHVGLHPYPGVIARLSRTPGAIRKPAPTLGEDNDFLFGELLGLSEDEVNQLEDDGIIGQEPYYFRDVEASVKA